jgi:hypothetical protein
LFLSAAKFYLLINKVRLPLAKVNGATAAGKKSAGFFRGGAGKFRRPRLRQGGPEFFSL